MKLICQLEVQDAVVKVSHDEHHNKYWWTFRFSDNSGREMDCSSSLAGAKDAAVCWYRFRFSLTPKDFRAKWKKV